MSEISLPPPQRVLLCTQVRDLLLKGILGGRWQACLPGERQLAAELSVSRPTLHEALLGLQQGGWIKIQHGKRTRILRRAASGKTHAPAVLNVLAPTFPRLWSLDQIVILEELKRHLRAQGIEVRLIANPRLLQDRCERLLQRLVRENPADGWLLASVSRFVQRWFAKRRLPALLDATAHPEVRLPSIDLDHRATCRHAAGRLFALGHRRIALFIQQKKLAGDIASEKGFREAEGVFEAAPREALIAHHDGTVAGMERTLRRLLAMNQPPTGLLVAGTKETLTALTFLARSGVRIPEDVSLLSRDWESFYEFLLPSPACYQFSPQTYERRLRELALRLMRRDLLPLKPVSVLPQFKEGATLAKPGSAAKRTFHRPG